jgi:sporulation protein YlmC with PRC-barrel domain
MKNEGHFKSLALVAACCITSAGGIEAGAQIVPNAATQPEIPQQTETMPAPGQPLRVNKCSRLIGTTVRNPQGERLGKIQDVVVDYDTGKVSYCVLNIARGEDRTQRCLAVPLTAMRPSADGAVLILNSDKAKLAEAQGFDRNNWPSVSNPAWGAQPAWETPAATPVAPSSHELPRAQ